MAIVFFHALDMLRNFQVVDNIHVLHLAVELYVVLFAAKVAVLDV